MEDSGSAPAAPGRRRGTVGLQLLAIGGVPRLEPLGRSPFSGDKVATSRSRKSEIPVKRAANSSRMPFADDSLAPHVEAARRLDHRAIVEEV